MIVKIMTYHPVVCHCNACCCQETANIPTNEYTQTKLCLHRYVILTTVELMSNTFDLIHGSDQVQGGIGFAPK